MVFIDKQLLKFKNAIESSIVTDGTKGKESMIRSSFLINHRMEAHLTKSGLYLIHLWHYTIFKI